MWMWDPRVGASVSGQRRDTLVQTIDLGVSLLDFFGIPTTATMIGKPLRLVRHPRPVTFPPR